MVLEKSDTTVIKLREWNKASPDTFPILKNFSFKDDLVSRFTAKELTDSGKVEILELADGLSIRTTSFVGSIRLGHLTLNILPKLKADCLLNLLRYAYGLRDIQLFALNSFSSKLFAFQDVLIFQLVSEVKELLRRGLLKRYRSVNHILPNPTGRIDFLKLTRQGGLVEAALPCNPYYRLENTLHNQLILAGLRAGIWLTNDLELRAEVRKLIRILEVDVDRVEINSSILDRVNRESNRQTTSYTSALEVIKLLYLDQGIQEGDNSSKLKLNGYLFDMNLFFQELISRLLAEYLNGYEVEDQHKLKGLLTYEQGYALPGRQDPIPKPDFAIFRNKKVVSLLDSKYRDLWETGLPRDMLYQLVVYALAQANTKKSIIVYPTEHLGAKEARISINDPNRGGQIGSVILKPVNLANLEKNIREKNTKELEHTANELILNVL